MMRILKSIIVAFLLVSIGLAAKVVPLPKLVNAESVLVDDNQMYISEGTSIYIYSLKDFQLKKKFGKKGEGPQEFIVRPPVPLSINLQKDHILVTSRGKMSLFSKEGVFIKETRIPAALVFFIKPFLKGFTGFRIQVDKEKVYRTINIHDAQLNTVKEVYRIENDFQAPGKGFNALVPEAYAVSKDKIFIPWKWDFCIDVFDQKGELIYSIKQKYKNRKVTEAHQTEIKNAFKINPQTKPVFEMMNPFHFPDYFPAVRDIRVTDNNVYALTYKSENDKTECFIFDIKGTLIKKVLVPLEQIDINTLYPFTIKNGKLYQLAENEDDAWELHISKVD